MVPCWNCARRAGTKWRGRHKLVTCSLDDAEKEAGFSCAGYKKEVK